MLQNIKGDNAKGSKSGNWEPSLSPVGIFAKTSHFHEWEEPFHSLKKCYKSKPVDIDG